MKPQTINQEILLFTDTSFAKRELREREDTNRNDAKNSVADKLEKACWSGLLFEMLPGIFNKNGQKNMYVWKVDQAEQFIHVALGNTSGFIAYETSIDPYFFLPLIVYQN